MQKLIVMVCFMHFLDCLCQSKISFQLEFISYQITINRISIIAVIKAILSLVLCHNRDRNFDVVGITVQNMNCLPIPIFMY